MLRHTEALNATPQQLRIAMRTDTLGFAAVLGVSLLLLPLLVDPNPLAARPAPSLAEATSPAGRLHLCAASPAQEHAGASQVRSEACAQR